MAERSGFTHRMISGWISDFSSIPRMEPWPSITLDGRMTADLLQCFDAAKAAGYTGIILWGLLAGRSWSPYLPDTVSEARQQQVKQILAEARQRNLKLLMGLGLYSWGFDAIIAEHPELDGGAPNNMCGSRPESWTWMQRVVDYIMDEYDPDGVSMQSSDMGRCPCDACQEMSSLAYHARINDQVAAYIRSRWPDKLIEISTWGMDLGNPADLTHVQHMTAHADVLNDFNNSSARQGRGNRQALIRNLACAFGTEQGWWVDPPPFWQRLKWFLPFSLSNVPYWHDLLSDGGKAVQRYILPLVNPGAEVGFIFDGIMLQDLHREPTAALEEALVQVFEPRTQAARQALAETWQAVENAFLAGIPTSSKLRSIGMNSVHYNGAAPVPALTERPEYLLRMKPERLAAYASALAAGLRTVQQVQSELGNTEKGVRLQRAMHFALADAEWVQGAKAGA